MEQKTTIGTAWLPGALALTGLLAAGCPGTVGDLLQARDSDPAVAGAVSCLPWTDQTRLEAAEPLVGVNSSSDELEPFVTRDDLELYFSSDRPGGKGGQDVYVATRSSADQAFSSPVAFSAASSGAEDGGLVLSTDGLTALLSSDRSGGKGGADIWIATRADASTPFVADDFSALAEVNTKGREFDPLLSQDGLRLYFTGDGVVTSGSLADVAVAERASLADAFGSPHEVPGINLPDGHEGNPALSGDELVVVFNSARQGGAGGQDLWYATRPTRDAAFSTPQPVPGVNSGASESEAFLTADGCALYFSRTVNGQRDLYRARVASGGAQ